MSASYLFDTDMCIYLKNKRPPQLAERFRELRRGDVVISVITYGELLNGALKSNQPEAALHNLQLLSERLPVQPLAVEVAEHYGRIRCRLEKLGLPIGGNDLWIAAHALALDRVLVTNNTREFERVAGLSLENWVG